MITLRYVFAIAIGVSLVGIAACGSEPSGGKATVIFQTATDKIGGPRYYPADSKAPKDAQTTCTAAMATVTQPWGRHGDAIDSVSDFSSLEIRIPLNQGRSTHVSLSHSAYKSSSDWSGTGSLEISQANPVHGHIALDVGEAGVVAGQLTVTFACP